MSSRHPPCPLLPATAIVLAAALSACAVGPTAPPNALVGRWATANNDVITIRQDTVVENQPDGRGTPLDSTTCNGNFSFRYAVWSRQQLSALLPRQPNLDKTLSETLTAPTYQVAQLRCDQGDHTYVLLNDRELIAIYRDGDIGAVEHLARL